jgi:hypothetical protein
MRLFRHPIGSILPTSDFKRQNDRQISGDKSAFADRRCDLVKGDPGTKGVTCEQENERENSSFVKLRASARTAALTVRDYGLQPPTDLSRSIPEVNFTVPEALMRMRERNTYNALRTL